MYPADKVSHNKNLLGRRACVGGEREGGRAGGREGGRVGRGGGRAGREGGGEGGGREGGGCDYLCYMNTQENTYMEEVN